MLDSGGVRRAAIMAVIPYGVVPDFAAHHPQLGRWKFQERMTMKRHVLTLVAPLAIALAMVCFAPPRAAADDDDPPTRVARLSHVDGTVSFEPAGTDDWVSAVVNRPMTTGDKLWADHDSRAELHLGASSIRLGANTGFSFLNLDDRTVQLQLTEGTLRI